MYVRLAFGVAAHLEPEILIVDEVLAVGDAAFQKKCLGKMQDVGEGGRTVLFVSHNMAAIEQLCSRAALLTTGQCNYLGDVKSAIDRYLVSVKPVSRLENEVLAVSKDGEIKLLIVEMIDTDGHSTSCIKCGQSIDFVIKFKSERKINNAALSVGINKSGSRVAIIDTRFSCHEMFALSTVTIVKCRIASFNLVEGVYTLDIKLLSGNESIIWAPDIADFTVEMGDFYGTGKIPDKQWGGVLHLKQTWEIIDNI
jgi:lipopolysaccharide transport system ATP-binding protein